MDEVALKRAIQRADKTQKLIETYRDAWKELEADIWRMWTQTKSEDKETREDLYREYHGVKAVQAKFQRIVNDGKKAEAELKQHGH